VLATAYLCSLGFKAFRESATPKEEARLEERFRLQPSERT
jgi:hypothetical protein